MQYNRQHYQQHPQQPLRGAAQQQQPLPLL
jgi:hypothetical protein